MNAAAGDKELPGWSGHERVRLKLLSVQREVAPGVTLKPLAAFRNTGPDSSHRNQDDSDCCKWLLRRV